MDLPMHEMPAVFQAPEITFPGMLEDGVYLGMPEDAYHAIPRLSASGIKSLLISPMDFWARSWMNPQRPASEPTEAMEMGTAYHKRILEGREAFYATYAIALDPADYPHALRTVDEIKDRLRSLGEKLGGNKPELVARLIEADPDTEIWDDLVSEHARANAGKTMVTFGLVRQIELAAAMIENHPDLSKCFTGGYPEVTVLWTDEETGVPMKARIDYLKAKATVDLKTFSNPLGKPVDRAIATAMAGGRYHIQAAVYREARAAMGALVKRGAVHGDGDRDWLARAAAADDPQFIFVFQQTGIAPVARGKVLPSHSGALSVGSDTAAQARHLFAQQIQTFGTDPWVDRTPLGTFDDTEFPAYAWE